MIDAQLRLTSQRSISFHAVHPVVSRWRTAVASGPHALGARGANGGAAHALDRPKPRRCVRSTADRHDWVALERQMKPTPSNAELAVVACITADALAA